MKSLVYGAMQALDAQSKAMVGLEKIIQVAQRNRLELSQQWIDDLDMLKRAEPFAWSKDVIDAVLSACGSIPDDTQFNSLNLGTESIWWFLERTLPWETFGDGHGVRAICMAPVATRNKPMLQFPAGSNLADVQCAIAGEPSAWEEVQYCVTAWSEHAEFGLIPGQTFDWIAGDSLKQMLQRASDGHDALYGPGRQWHGKTANKERFLESTEGVARFVLAGLVWLHQKIVVADVQHIERHARKRIEQQLKRQPVLRLVQLRRTEHVQPTDDTVDPAKREYSHRWTVDGHWRNQRVGPGRKETRLTWVMPYIKGPDDKPLVVSSKKVYVVSR